MDKSILLITGASSGIGYAIAERAVAVGYRKVVMTYRSNADGAARMEEMASAAGATPLIIKGDIGEETDVMAMFDEIDRRFGPVTHLVNNAGITGGFSKLDDLRYAETLNAFRTNVLGAMMCCREAIRRMARCHGGMGGAIVNISSTVARTGGAGEWVHYAATKGALDSLTIGAAREWASEGVRINAVAPGLVHSDLHERNGDADRPFRLAPAIPMGRPGTPDEVAGAVLWLLSGEASYTTGAILEVGGGR